MRPVLTSNVPSSAGIYIPMLAEAILNASSATDPGSSWRPGTTCGIGVGNGCLGQVGKCSAQGRISVEFLYGHGVISQPTYEQLKVQCPDFTNPNALCEKWLTRCLRKRDRTTDTTFTTTAAERPDEPNGSKPATRSPGGAVSARVAEQPDGSGRGFGYRVVTERCSQLGK